MHKAGQSRTSAGSDNGLTLRPSGERSFAARIEESEKGAVMPSILGFDVNDSMLDIQHLAPLFERLFGDRKFVDEWYAQLILYSEAITLSGGPYAPFFNLSQAVLKMMG